MKTKNLHVEELAIVLVLVALILYFLFSASVALGVIAVLTVGFPFAGAALMDFMQRTAK